MRAEMTEDLGFSLQRFVQKYLWGPTLGNTAPYEPVFVHAHIVWNTRGSSNKLLAQKLEELRGKEYFCMLWKQDLS